MFTHVEVQGEQEADFPLRMYTYNYRLFDRYQRPVVSLAILGDDSASWRPDHYRYELWGCWAGLGFPIVKLRDYNERWQELEASDNLFAIVVMAHLKTRATRHDPEDRLRWKNRLARHLYRAGHERQDVLELLRFIDWVLRLPPELEQRFDENLERFEAETKMRYVTRWERKGIEKGLQQGLERGMLQGEASLLKRLLKRRFQQLPPWVEQRLEVASREELERWADRVTEVEALEEVFAAE